MDSIEKAREAIRKDQYTNANLAIAFDAGEDAFPAQTLEVVLDAIESELDEHYMLLPLDAYGTPIHPDDIMSCTAFDTNDYDGKKCAMAVGNGFWVDVDGCTHISSETIHAKLRTVDDVLREFAHEMNANLGMYVGEAIDAEEWRDADYETIRKFAAEIRELMGVGE